MEEPIEWVIAGVGAVLLCVVILVGLDDMPRLDAACNHRLPFKWRAKCTRVGCLGALVLGATVAAATPRSAVHRADHVVEAHARGGPWYCTVRQLVVLLCMGARETKRRDSVQLNTPDLGL
jgi:hypothetical protein